MKHIVQDPGVIAALAGSTPIVVASAGMQSGRALLIPIWIAWAGALAYAIVNAGRKSQHA